MTAISVDEAVVQFDNASDALQDVSADVISGTLDLTINGTQYHTLDSRWAKANEGGIMGTLTLNYVNDTSATSLAGYIRAWIMGASAKGGARSVRIQSPNASAGSTQYDFEVFPGGPSQMANKTAGGGDVEQLPITLNISGAVTVATIT